MLSIEEFGRNLKSRVRETALYEWRMRVRGRHHGPRFTQVSGELGLKGAKATFVVICGAEFDQSKPNAATTMRLGWCHGFQELGIPYLLASVYELEQVLPQLTNPICWIAGSDYAYLDDRSVRTLRRYPHAVLVSTAFKGDAEYFASHGFPQQSWHARLRRKILSSEPRFLFSISPESRFEFYTSWLVGSVPLVSLPLACDSSLYEIAEAEKDGPGPEMAFVGGYWPYKARQFDIYLRPLQELLTVYGYSKWPYGKYGGQLATHLEGQLYAKALVSPVINEPHVSAMGVDINERVFKVMGSGGLAVTDATPWYREWFSNDELLVPESPGEFEILIRDAIARPDSYSTMRQKAMQAIRNAHTYRHRAEKFARLLGIAVKGAGSVRHS